MSKVQNKSFINHLLLNSFFLNWTPKPNSVAFLGKTVCLLDSYIISHHCYNTFRFS